MTAPKISIGQQIEEVQRELDLRASVYPRLVGRGEMRQSVADYHMARMQAALRTLIFVNTHQDVIVTVHASKKAAEELASKSGGAS